jgi:long-chain acyl-CoA synthetase
MSQVTHINHIRRVFETGHDRPFLIESMTRRSWTFAEFFEWALRAATLLKSQGIKKGDRVALILANSAEFAAMYFGCLFIGAVAVPVNQALHPEDVSYVLKHSGAKLLLFSRCTRALVLQATESLSSLKQVRVALGQEVSFHPEDLDEVWSYDQATVDPDLVPFAGLTDDDILLVLFTSGTTGRPKGVVHSIRSEFGNAVAFNEAMHFGPGNRFLHIWPMAYSSGYLNVLISPFMAGGSVVLSCAFTAQTVLSFWKPVIGHEANTLWLSPTMMASLLRLDRDGSGIDYCKKQIAAICVGTAPLSSKLKNDFEAKYGVECMESYGLSELLIISANTPSFPRLENSVGKPLGGVELATASEQGILQHSDQEGEILVRTPFKMIGYLAEETSRVEIQAADEWFPTGDIGFLQADGNVFITGRKKDLIIRGGQNLSPRAVRECLLNHPSILDAVVVGIPHDFYGEEVAAALKLDDGRALADEQSSILEHCRKHLAQAAVPTKLRQFDEFPVGSSGKVLDREIKRIFSTLS